MPTKTKTTEPANDAITEVIAETVPDADIFTVTWRDTEFKIPRRVFNTPQVAFALSSNNPSDQVYRILEQADKSYPRLYLSLCKDGDEILPLAIEFFDLLNAQAGSGNS